MPDSLKKLQVTEVQGPDLRPTGQMPSPLRLERLLEESIAIGKVNTDAIGRVDAKVDMFGAGLTTVADDVAKLKAAHEERARKHSGGIARVSENDSRQDAAIASIVTTVKAIEAKTDLQTTILQRGEEAGKKLWANPYVRAIAVGLALYILAVLRKHGIEVVP